MATRPPTELVTECCGRPIAAGERFCSRCGWECRAVAAPPRSGLTRWVMRRGDCELPDGEYIAAADVDARFKQEADDYLAINDELRAAARLDARALIPTDVMPQPHKRHASLVIDYVTEEVWRQGHDLSSRDGIERVGWMLDAWSYALVSDVFDVRTIKELGRRVEREKNAKGFRHCAVSVGGEYKPNWRKVGQQLFTLCNRQREMEPLEFYRAFEQIHPFVDGNGRTGKILLNWLNGTLIDPIFPPADFWGRPIQNP